MQAATYYGMYFSFLTQERRNFYYLTVEMLKNND